MPPSSRIVLPERKPAKHDPSAGRTRSNLRESPHVTRVRLVPPGAIFKAPGGELKSEISSSPPDFTPCFCGALSRFGRPLPATSSPPRASSHLQSLILRPPHIFLPLLDVRNPLILFISHALGSSLSSSASVASFSHLSPLYLPSPPLLSLIIVFPTPNPSLLTSNRRYPP